MLHIVHTDTYEVSIFLDIYIYIYVYIHIISVAILAQGPTAPTGGRAGWPNRNHLPQVAIGASPLAWLCIAFSWQVVAVLDLRWRCLFSRALPI